MYRSAQAYAAGLRVVRLAKGDRVSQELDEVHAELADRGAVSRPGLWWQDCALWGLTVDGQLLAAAVLMHTEEDTLCIYIYIYVYIYIDM